MKITKLESNVVVDLLLGYLGVVSNSVVKYDIYRGLALSVKVGKKNFFVDSEKIAFLRSIGIKVDVEMEGGSATLEITLPYERNNGLMDVDSDDMANLLCEFFRDVFLLDDSYYELKGFVRSGCLSVRITRTDGDDLRLDFHNVKSLTHFDITPFFRPVQSNEAYVGFVY